MELKRRKMKVEGTTMTVNSILFESNDTDVLINANMSQGVMNYDTDLVITHSQLNIIFNSLQRQNQNISVHNYLKSEKMYDGEFLYSADFSNLVFNQIDLLDIEGNEPLKQIRA